MTVQFKTPAQLDPKLIEEMNAYETFLLSRWPAASIVVNTDFSPGTGHVSDSQHYPQPPGGLGRAVDFFVRGVSLLDAWLALERFEFNGVGFYPDWNTPGFHADVRAAAVRARWARYGNQYVDFDRGTVVKMLGKMG